MCYKSWLPNIKNDERKWPMNKWKRLWHRDHWNLDKSISTKINWPFNHDLCVLFSWTLSHFLAEHKIKMRKGRVTFSFDWFCSASELLLIFVIWKDLDRITGWFRCDHGKTCRSRWLLSTNVYLQSEDAQRHNEKLKAEREKRNMLACTNEYNDENGTKKKKQVRQEFYRYVR